MVRIIDYTPAMIVCVCNALTEAEIRTAARNGSPCPRSAYRSLGFEPQCCACLEYAREVIEDERAKTAAIGSQAA